MYHSLTTSRFARLHPDVDAAGRERLLLPGLQVRSVHAVGDAVVLPDEVVVPLAHEAAVGRKSSLERRRACPPRRVKVLLSLGAEIGLEHQLVGRVVAVGVDQLRQHRLALVVEHHVLAASSAGRQLAQVREGDGDGLPSAGDRQRVLHLHGDRRRGGGGAAAGAGATAGRVGGCGRPGRRGRVRRPGRRRAGRAAVRVWVTGGSWRGNAWSRSVNARGCRPTPFGSVG